MAQLVNIEIDIDGKKIAQFSSFALSQHIFEHHYFKLVCPSETIDGNGGAFFNTSKNLIGATLKAKIEAVGTTGSMQFTGVVVQVEASRYAGHTGDIIITGYSPTILADNGPHCKTWEKKALKNIAQDVLKHFPQNLLQPKINPAYSETLSYTVQYKETAWQFLSRLCATYGEWLFYDGQKLVVGSPGGNKTKLCYGKNLDRFNMALQVRPASFHMMAYDYMNHEVYDGKPAGIESKAGLNDLGKHALHKSESFYGTEPKQWHNQFLTNKKQLDDFVNTRASMQSSHLVKFNGSSGHPGVTIGSGISAEGKNIVNHADEVFGEYTITAVQHYCDGQGNYKNDFTAIPASVKMPPVNNLRETHCETQSAIVTDNNDSKGLARVRVKFHWMKGAEKSPWIRVTTPHAGGGKGMFIMPEVGEEVIIGFEGDSATKPYVIGSVYHGKAKCEFANGGNDVKAFQSRSGNRVVLNDKDGSVLVCDAKGNNITIDGKGNINVFSTESIVFACGKGGASMIQLDSKGNILLKGKEITVVASAKVALGSGSVNGNSFDGSGLNFDPSNIAIGAKQKCEIAGGTESKLLGGAVSVQAMGETVITGSKVNIN